MHNKKLIIYGNGQMARMFWHFAQLEFEVAAFTVDQAVLRDTVIEGLPVIPFEEIEMHCPPDEHNMITAVGYLEMNELRARKYREGLAKGYAFANYIHPSVVRHASVSMGDNNVILDHVAIHPYTRLGNSIFICSNASIGHGCDIGDNCWINSGVSIGGEAVIGESSFLGINATIGDNIRVDRQCFVGANTLVSHSTGAEEVHISASGERFPLPSKAFLKFISRGGK